MNPIVFNHSIARVILAMGSSICSGARIPEKELEAFLYNMDKRVRTQPITAKIAKMVEKEKIDLSQILALTFYKEAARNMRESRETATGKVCFRIYLKVCRLYHSWDHF
jgi:hypothetical protein